MATAAAMALIALATTVELPAAAAAAVESAVVVSVELSVATFAAAAALATEYSVAAADPRLKRGCSAACKISKLSRRVSAHLVLGFDASGASSIL
eukprot:5281220-Pleurochrysis_carterae.AAC.2